MAERSAKKLDRILRVRTLQLDLSRADEARAAEKLASETALRHRIAQLAANVAPSPSPMPTTALGFAASAHLRDRLHQSAAAADARVAQAERGVGMARHAAQSARRDQKAVEKLIERAELDAALKALRELETLPATALRKRHDPC
jgi:flagellar FliJ protein